MHGWITCRAGVIPGNAGDVIDNEIGARGGVGVRAVGIQCLKWRIAENAWSISENGESVSAT